MRDGLASVGILLVSQGEDSMGDMLESLIRGVGGRRMSPTKKMNSWGRRNWTVLRWPVNLVYFHELKQKYNTNITRLAVC